MYRLIFFIVFLPIAVFGQGEIADYNVNFKDFLSVGVGLKSNGYGVSYRKGYYVNIYGRNYYEIEARVIHDPREIKFSNPYYFTTENIYYAKVNSCFDIRAGKGKMKILTNKQDKGSVEIRLLTSMGATLGFMKPVYYTVLDKTATYTYDTKFTEDLLLQQIVEMAPFYEGLDEIKINPGGYAKLGISFEHSKKSLFINALEAGVSTSVYLLPMQMIYGDRGRNVIVNLYLTYRIGQYFDPRSLKRRKKMELLKAQQ